METVALVPLSYAWIVNVLSKTDAWVKVKEKRMESILLFPSVTNINIIIYTLSNFVIGASSLQYNGRGY